MAVMPIIEVGAGKGNLKIVVIEPNNNPIISASNTSFMLGMLPVFCSR